MGRGGVVDQFAAYNVSQVSVGGAGGPPFPFLILARIITTRGAPSFSRPFAERVGEGTFKSCEGTSHLAESEKNPTGETTAESHPSHEESARRMGHPHSFLGVKGGPPAP